MFRRCAVGLSLTSRVCPAADSANRTLHTTHCAWRTAQTAEHAVTRSFKIRNMVNHLSCLQKIECMMLDVIMKTYERECSGHSVSRSGYHRHRILTTLLLPPTKCYTIFKSFWPVLLRGIITWLLIMLCWPSHQVPRFTYMHCHAAVITCTKHGLTVAVAVAPRLTISPYKQPKPSFFNSTYWLRTCIILSA